MWLQNKLKAACQGKLAALKQLFNAAPMSEQHGTPENPAVSFPHAAMLLTRDEFCPTFSDSEKQLLLLLLLEWDLHGEGCIYLVNVMRMAKAVASA